MSWRGYMTGTTGCARRDAAMNYRTQNPYRSIGMSDRAAANALNGGGGSCPTSTTTPKVVQPDRNIWKDLQSAAKSGYGITKPELKSIVQTHQRNGGLSASKQKAISNAVEAAMFARQTTGNLAKQLGKGADLSLLS